MQETNAEDSPGSDPREAGPSPWRLWGPALGVIAALVLVHWGLWLLLTRGAREVVAEIEGQYDAGALAEAHKPGPEPQARTDEWFRWQKNQRVWSEVERLSERRDWIATLRWGLTASCLLQCGFVAWLALRAMNSSASTSTGRGAVRARG